MEQDAAGQGGDGGGREDFLWVRRKMWADRRHRRNLFAFARRHDLAVVVVHARSNVEGVGDELRPALSDAAAFDLDAWLNVGAPHRLTPESFVEDRAGRERHLARLREAVRVHGEFFDGGRVILWQEAPVMGQWVEGGAWNQAAVDNMLEFGPRMFAAQHRAVRDANPALDVGCFVHFPYVVDSKQPEVFAELVDGFRAEGVVPEFACTDFYRGWYEKDVGPGPANAAVRSLVSNTREHLGGRPVFYLGQSHTVNPGHTPSRQALRMNLRASLSAGAAGVGWYARSSYVPTTAGFDPFVPNAEDATFADEPANTATFARDRYVYPWLATLAATPGFDATDAFDLWLVADDAGFYDHRASVRTPDGTWEFVGDARGYVGGDYPYADTGATVFRALDRDRLLGDGRLELRVETPDGSDGATLRSVLAMPCDPDAYVTERRAAALAADADLSGHRLGRADPVLALSPGEGQRVTVDVPDFDDGAEADSLRGLVHPGHATVVERLAAFEDREGVEPRRLFDLWVVGEGFDDGGALPSVVDVEGESVPVGEAAVVTVMGGGSTDDRVALCYGLARERFRPGNGLAFGDDAGSTARVTAAYAMPYAGSATFRSPAEVGSLVEEQPGEVATFSVDAVNPS